MREEKTGAKAVASLVMELPEDELIVLAHSDNRPALREFIRARIAAAMDNVFVTPLGDGEVPEKFRRHLVGRRELATFLGWPGHIAYRVRAGHTLKDHAPKSGPCRGDFKYLQGWNLQNDEPTEDSIVFWVPRLIPESLGKNVADQMEILQGYRRRFKLPTHDLRVFGSAALLSALILAHHKRTGEKVPQKQFWTRTDTLRAGGGRLSLGSFVASLDCFYWFGDDNGSDDLGCFPLGVEILGTGA